MSHISRTKSNPPQSQFKKNSRATVLLRVNKLLTFIKEMIAGILRQVFRGKPMLHDHLLYEYCNIGSLIS